MIKCYANANAILATFVSKINAESMTDCYCISQNKLTWESTLLLPVWSLEFLLSNAVISPRLLRLLLWDFPTSDLLLLLEGSTGNVVDWLDEWGLGLLGCCLLVRRGGESSWSDFLSPEKYRECSPLVRKIRFLSKNACVRLFFAHIFFMSNFLFYQKVAAEVAVLSYCSR